MCLVHGLELISAPVFATDLSFDLPAELRDVVEDMLLSWIYVTYDIPLQNKNFLDGCMKPHTNYWIIVDTGIIRRSWTHEHVLTFSFPLRSRGIYIRNVFYSRKLNDRAWQQVKLAVSRNLVTLKAQWLHLSLNSTKSTTILDLSDEGSAGMSCRSRIQISAGKIFSTDLHIINRLQASETKYIAWILKYESTLETSFLECCWEITNLSL